jgi:hypothetical protein
MIKKVKEERNEIDTILQSTVDFTKKRRFLAEFYVIIDIGLIFGG